MARGSNKKVELINAAFDLLQTTSPDEITIRGIAARANCTSTVIYRHFDNLEHLILVSSVRFLEDYMSALNGFMQTGRSAYETFIAMWREFAYQSFHNVEVFEILFWKVSAATLSDAITEYYQIFPEKWQGLNGVFSTVFFSSELMQRNLVMLKRVAAENVIAHKDVDMINEVQCYMFHGMLVEYKECYRQPRKPEEAIERFMGLMEYFLSLCSIKKS